MAGSLKGRQHLARLLAEINFGRGRAQGRAASSPSFPSQDPDRATPVCSTGGGCHWEGEVYIQRLLTPPTKGTF